MAHAASNDKSPDSGTMEIDIGEPEIAQCLKIMPMTEEEILANPVLYNPFIVCLIIYNTVYFHLTMILVVVDVNFS